MINFYKFFWEGAVLKRFFRLSGLKIALLSTLAVLAIFYLDPDFLSLLELKTLDLRFLSRGKIATTGEVALVTIDEKSLDELGRWPWPRVRLAKLLDALVKYDAKVVGFDIVWAEPDENSALKNLFDIKQKMKELNLTNQGLENYLSQAIQKADTDLILADSVARSGRAVLGYFFHFSPKEGLSPEKKNLQQDLPPLSAYNLVKYASEEAAKVRLFEADSAEVNLPIISEAAEGAGYFNIFPDRDGTVRWIPLVIKYQDKHYCALSLAVLQKFLGNPPLFLRIAEFGVEEVRLGDLSIPTNEEGRMLINYHGPQRTFPHYSATDVIHGRVPANAFKGKIVLVGATAIGIYDIRVTPFDHVFPGMEVHANVIDTILKQRFLYRPNWIALVDILAIVLIGLILGFILPRIKALWGALSGGVLFLAFLLTSDYLFQKQGFWVNQTYPVFNLVLTYLTITGYRYMTEEREKKKVRGAFQYYLNASVVEQMLINPERLKLGGEKKDLTVLFSDIRGFTSISEHLTPERLVKFLNEYLTQMTDIVFKYDGLLDKYMGDAIMAIWGAPLDQADHTLRACYTALEMVEELQRLQKKWAAEGMPGMNIGIGINAGPMVVGNMGSERRFDYTVMGDSVNLGSRLEGLNKLYGTYIIVSEMTYERVQGEVLGRELDWVRVKGKDQPVKIYELLSRRAKASAEQKALTEEFRAALVEYRNRRWEAARKTFQSLRARYPEDGPAKLYVERCETLEKTPPPDDWDGVYIMDTK
ncbi:MAG: adenylate/guanylate cyclase domain-containing protein [Thermodesulfobacteriota bacterium]|nr:adenylate/guanylate cyclase domain-containing protein [Thermodesulfobacteriota bacterium]